MKKVISIYFLFISLGSFAHEGMWIPSLLKALEGDMQAQGLKLSAEDIYSINRSSLKDAIVHFGGGCTAEVVSSTGLILTNHHCGYSQIQQHSTLENNYLKNGFWAMSSKEELKNPGLTATFIVRIEDVTSKVNDQVTEGMNEEEADNIRYDNIAKITEEAVKGTFYKADVVPFYYGNEYYMIVSKTYNDVRLVGAPPSSMGKFGGDTDNWIWPRHTCDFSVFRIYANKENEPADISDENIPYSPGHHFPVTLEGIQENDFTMVFGFPGTTQQYLSSYAVEDYINVINPARISMREQSLSVIDAAMSQSEETYIKYASKQSRISNAYKKWIGQNLGLKKKDALGKKKKIEAEYLSRVPRDGKYKNLLQDMKSLQHKLTKYELAANLHRELWYYGPEIIRFAYSFNQILKEGSSDRIDRRINGFFKNYDPTIDQQIFLKLLPMYFELMEDDLEPEIKKTIDSKFNGDYQKYTDYAFDKSMITSKEKVIKLLSNNKKAIKQIKKDPLFVLAMSIVDKYDKDIRPNFLRYYFQMEELMKKYLEAQMKYFPEKTFWADANSTLRLTYGKVEGSYPRDGMKYTWFTTLDGIIEKNNTGNDDFVIPDRLRNLWENKNYGRYGSDGQLNICFLGSNHTTGGNSGSPAINGEGHLVGINFDRTWESTMSDVMFDGEICRNIMVDIRYVLWVMDVYAGAGHLVNEMTIVDEEYRIKQELKKVKYKIEQLGNRLKDVPNDYHALMLRSEAYFELGNEDKAFNDINYAIELYPKNQLLLNYRASYFEKNNLLDKASKDVSRSLKVNDNDNEEAYFIRGVILTDQKKYKEAIRDFNRVIEIDYTHYKSYYNMAVCYHLLGDTDNACKNFEMAKVFGGEEVADMYHAICDGSW